MFPKYTAATATTENELSTSLVGNETISVVMLGGDSTVVPYRPGMTIQELKNFVQIRLGPAPQKQRLLCNDKELKVRGECIDCNMIIAFCYFMNAEESCANRGIYYLIFQTHLGTKLATLQDYSVQPFNTLHLIVVLYEINHSLDNAVFDLFWGYPSSGCDYLDASVLIYSGSSLQGIVDYRHQAFNGISHSGDVMDAAKCLGHHTIYVQLKSLPSNINKLFFTLSAWNSPNISKYKNPSLRFFDAKAPNKQLCSDQMGHAAYSQAVIMCCLSKIDGVWKVFSLRTLSAGNAKNYVPLGQTIGGIITQGLC